MTQDVITISKMLSWDLSSASLVAGELMILSTKLETEVNAADSAIQGSQDYFGKDGGSAARTVSANYKTDGNKTADVYDAIHIAIDNVNHSLQPKLDELKVLVKEIESSKFDFFYDDSTGAVRSRQSNFETSYKVFPYGPGTILEKTRLQWSYSGALSQLFWDIQEIDAKGAEQVAKCLEKVGDSVKILLANLPSDPALAKILLDYQVSASDKDIRVWPGAELYSLIKTYMPDFTPLQVTEEEARLLETLAKNRPLDIVKFVQIQQDADRLGKDNKYTKEKPSSKDDGHADALRHAYWNARMTQEFGESWTQAYATAHEKTGGNNPQREAMDLKNNELGRSIGADPACKNATPDQIRAAVEQSIDTGKAIVILDAGNNTTQIGWSSKDNVGQTTQIAGVGIPLPGK
ncbi:hypothetical protein LTV02_39050 [Nocardia yamanashiensis]|uniref:DUF6973 domain-containing protein n=1 Tax=Nocardia yamanashiensis TaxID=209247 RepID=UPI001E62D78C|nr:hypothetical protein [Nocardia yamanashiensis]UGT41833.1 hypothetical protein LTV02_39050 [Nocardia yamanashiensis]